MPNIKSAKKRVKVNAAKALRNKSIKSSLHTAVKKADVAISTGAENKEDALKVAIKCIDKAVAKGILHKNTAARKKSRLVLSNK
ncbi:MAG TPA: 30S ribosomal protein S20 [Ruminiclostridium sp.]|nr:30S ribosomal protein S20 [Ruminiclostridium sp.]